MKFKVVFFIFNGIIVFSFLFVFLLPFFFFGWEYTQMFWAENWYIALAFLAILAGLNTYFGLNWRLFRHLENEDWHSLIGYLEDKVYERGQIRRQYVRLLINAYIVVSRPEKITELEGFLRERKPSLVPQFAVQLGIPHLMSNDAEEIERYYGEMRSRKQCKERDWVDWAYAFALMLQQKSDAAKEILLEIHGRAKNVVLRLITLYLLDAFTPSDEHVRNLVREGKRQLQASYTTESWNKEIDKNRGNLQVLVLSRLIRDATSWAFHDGTQAA
jgi:hypothetical protein